MINLSFDILESLNDEQKEAVITTEGYIRVIAGAGTGKTKALTHRFAYLVNYLDISTSNILCVTFTNKAANEMKKRIRGMIGDNDTSLICTFHGFCVQVLREDIHTMNYPQNFIIMDAEDTEAVLKTVYQDAGINSRNYTFDMAREKIIKLRKVRGFEHIPYVLQLNNTELKNKYLNSEKIEDRIFFGYLYEQKKSFGLDFDDLMTFVHYILSNFQEKRIKWQKRLEYIMVDEFQDVSELQYALADILSGYHKNLFIVGDPDQTIYTWRGAKINNILDFDKKYPTAKTIIMNTNYRSTSNILNASNSLIQKNKQRIEKNLVALKPSKIPVIYNHAKTTKMEAEWIAKQINILLSNGNKLNDIAILYRSHFISRNIEEIFIKEKIQYTLYSGIEFYKRKEIKDVLSYLRMIAHADDLSFLRVVNEPKRNIGDRRITFLKEYSEINNCSLYISLKNSIENELFKKTKAMDFIELIDKYQSIYKELKISDLLDNVLNESGYEAMLRQAGEQDRLDNIAELKQSIFDYENDSGEDNYLVDYLEKISLFTNIDQKEKANTIKMMTIHTAKGLEFPYVFVCGLNEGIFPNKHVDTLEKLEEERRLAYVAYTRAENALFLSDSEGINYDGSFRYPSRFIFNTEKMYLNYEIELEDNLIDDAQKYIDSNESNLTFDAENLVFKVGDKVEHVAFGIGEIIAINKDSSSYVINFEKTDVTANP